MQAYRGGLYGFLGMKTDIPCREIALRKQDNSVIAGLMAIDPGRHMKIAHMQILG